MRKIKAVEAQDKSLERCSALEKECWKLAKTNAELEDKLAEIYFTHEFFKALTGRVNVMQVSALISDGAVGILGSETACVYLNHRESELELKGAQGRSLSDFKQSVKLGETVIGVAIEREELTEHVDPSPDDSFLANSASWTGLQAAIPLKTQETALGVVAIATAKRNKLTPAERERFENIANMSTLALHNALLNEELEWLSVTDRLTELYDYGYFQGRLREELHRAERMDHKISLIMIDIDYFKDYNDAFGHPKGDLVLKRLAQILRDNTRDIDIIARYGGEEFAIILPETEKQTALVAAERIRMAVERTEFAGNENLPIVNKTISLGVACYPDDAKNPESLIEKTDEALYAAKWRGRNRTQSI